MIQSLQTLEFSILNSIQYNLRSSVMDFLMVAFTRLSEAGVFWLVLAIALMFVSRYRRAGLTLLMSQIIVIIGNEVILKNIFSRPRPPDLNPYIYLLVSRPDGFAFPSGHATLSFAAATVLFYYNKKFGAAAFVFAVIIAFSRVYLYVHFPTDVIVGAVSGVMFACLTIAIVKRIYASYEMIKHSESDERVSGLSEAEAEIVYEQIRARARKYKTASAIVAACVTVFAAVLVITGATGVLGLVMWFPVLIMVIVAVVLMQIGILAEKKESRLTEKRFSHVSD